MFFKMALQMAINSDVGKKIVKALAEEIRDNAGFRATIIKVQSASSTSHCVICEAWSIGRNLGHLEGKSPSHLPLKLDDGLCAGGK